jgi:hypothetical protein
MGRQSSAKGRGAGSQPPATPRNRVNYGLIAVAAALVLGIGAFALRSNTFSTAPSVQDEPKGNITDVHPTPDVEAEAKANAALGPHKQESYPPIPFQGYAPPRPTEVVTAAFEFAAEHPEIASYVPCVCGCQMMGHHGNEQCFVKSRAPNGDVTEWEPHGVDCAICIDVATRSRQMYSAGASARDIRSAIEKEFAPAAHTMTPTPRPGN